MTPKQSTYLALAAYREMSAEGIGLSGLAARARRTQGAMSQLLGRGYRAAPETIAALSRGWRTAGAGARILIAHLQDEIRRAGWRVAEYSIEHRASAGPRVLSGLDRDLADLRAAAEHVPALAELVSNVLDVARAELPADLFRSGGRTQAAAESHTDYAAPSRGEPTK